MRGEFLSVQAAFDMMPRFSTTGLFDTIFAQQGSYTFTLPAAPGTLATLDDVAAVVASADTVVAAVAAEATARAEAEAAEAAARTVAITAETTRALKAENANATAIATNVTAIGVNAAAITANTTAIGVNAAAITALSGPGTASLGSNGYEITASGLIRNWGFVTTGTNGRATAAYLKAFPTSGFVFLQSVAGAGGPSALTSMCAGIGLTSTDLWVAQSNTGLGISGVSVYWEAIGH